MMDEDFYKKRRRMKLILSVWTVLYALLFAVSIGAIFYNLFIKEIAK
jgi:hypothetical protein